MNRRTFGLVALILVATALRLFRLAAQDIWGDEAFSIFLSQQPLATVVAGAADTHPPFYPFLLFLWLTVAGSSAFATRALSALIGILAVPLIFALARRLATAPRVAWFAAILATVSPLLIYYSQETRMYELVAVLALASTYFATRIVKPAAPLGRYSVYFVVTTLALYTHYSAFFTLSAQNVFAFTRLRKDRATLARWLVVQAALGVAYVPWIFAQTAFLRGKASARFDEWGWRGIEMIFGKTQFAFSVGLTMEAQLAFVASSVFLLAALVGVIVTWRARDTRAALALLAWLVPVGIAYCINPIMPFFFERYVLVALPGFILTVALGLEAISRYSGRAGLGFLSLMILFSAFSLDGYFFNDAFAKGKYGQMMQFIAAHAQPGDAIILNNPLQKPLYRYYAPNLPAYFLPDGDASLQDPGSRAQLAQIAQTHPRVWLVQFGNPAEYDPTGYLEQWLAANAFKALARGFVDAALNLYALPNPAPAVTRELRATLGDTIQLRGYDLDRTEIAPGQIAQLTLRWQATAPVAARYKVFAHVLGEHNPAMQSPVWAQMDHEPVGGTRATTTWQPGETIVDRYGLLLPTEIPPGAYQIEIGMYDPQTGARAPALDAAGTRLEADRILLMPLQVQPRR